MDIPIYYSM